VTLQGIQQNATGEKLNKTVDSELLIDKDKCEKTEKKLKKTL